MKVIIVSDTHIPKKAKVLPNRLLQELEEADCIIHAGDWQAKEVFHELQQYGKLYGVSGNVDGEDIKQLMPEKQVVEANGWKIGIVHGHGDKKTTEKRAVEAFNEHVDIIVFGHSHLPVLKFTGKTMLFNPGSVTDKRKLPYYSFGKLILDDEIHAEHVFFKN
ncbi:hypothetical protein SAMN05192534_11328 [Alteribacillus persepolensis]|uniref:Phosphoesterase n=1 Tax=Alteribacillus persepolensis TaxID=568899 RepID=A0A1G8FUP6_9BACI|nr:metallophosphoesterase [Alteribacillus persepolensis]SDH85859.1 hypothetical protein SAMN05192534_11328 [Alteribacillus persepolensis]